MAEVLQSYRYVRPSELRDGLLGLQTSGGVALLQPASHPVFFTGFLTRPAVTAAGLHAVAKVAATKYYRPDLLPYRDPVVTCHRDRLRFESFSGCCGVYARLDVLAEAIDGDVCDVGTTNVDVGEPLRRMLARVGDSDPLRLTVGSDELTLATLDGVAVEKKAALPRRWLRGFAELQVITASFEPRVELSVMETIRLLRSLSGSSWPRGSSWLVPAGRTLRLSTRPTPGAVCLAGPQRLDALTALLRFATGLRIYGPTVTATSMPCASAWELELPGARFVIVLSPELSRGFSGEGAVLDSLATEDIEDDTELVAAMLSFQSRIEPDLLAEQADLSRERVRSALAHLGMAGRVGFDLAEAGYFHRELPYETGLVDELNPRLRAARALADSGAVVVDGNVARVRDHLVRFGPDGVSCTCPWWARHRGSRGKCTHVLAAELTGRTS
jgi:hypothetical protein